MDKNGKKFTHYLKPLIEYRADRILSRCQTRCQSRCQSVAQNGTPRTSGSRTTMQMYTKPKPTIREHYKPQRKLQLSPLPSRSYVIDDGYELQAIRAPATKRREPKNSISESEVDRPAPSRRSKHVNKAKAERCQSEMHHSDTSDRPDSSRADNKLPALKDKLLRVAKNMNAVERTDMWPDRGKTSNAVRQECLDAGIQLISRNWRTTQSSISFDLTFGTPKHLMPRVLPRILSTSVLEENWQKKEIQKQQTNVEELADSSKKGKKVVKMSKRARYEQRRKQTEARRREKERQRLLEKAEAEERSRAAYEREWYNRQVKRKELEVRIIEEQKRERMK